MEREKLEVLAGSAAHPPGTTHVEVLLIGYPPAPVWDRSVVTPNAPKRFWQFELGPVAAKTLAVMLMESAGECEALESEHE